MAATSRAPDFLATVAPLRARLRLGARHLHSASTNILDTPVLSMLRIPRTRGSLRARVALVLGWLVVCSWTRPSEAQERPLLLAVSAVDQTKPAVFYAAHSYEGDAPRVDDVPRYALRGLGFSPSSPAMELQAAHQLGRAQLVLEAGYGQLLIRDDRFGRARAAVLSRVVDALHVGLDARANFDLGFEDDTAGEAAFDITSGALLSYLRSTFVLSLYAGPSVLRLTDQPSNGQHRAQQLLGMVSSVGLGLIL